MLTTDLVITRKWYTMTEVGQMLGFGLSKMKMLVITGEIRSVKIGKHRRILPAWVDEYIERVTDDEYSGDAA